MSPCQDVNYSTEKRKETSTPFGINSMGSQVLYRVAQEQIHRLHLCKLLYLISSCSPDDEKPAALMMHCIHAYSTGVTRVHVQVRGPNTD